MALAIDDNWLAMMERRVSVSSGILVCGFLGDGGDDIAAGFLPYTFSASRFAAGVYCCLCASLPRKFVFAWSEQLKFHIVCSVMAHFGARYAFRGYRRFLAGCWGARAGLQRAGH